MSLVALAWRYLASRPLLTALHVAMVAIAVATLVFLLLLTDQTGRRLEVDARPVDLVVGAKGSPLQLILSAVLHADVPTGNIRYAEGRALARDPMVAAAIPVAVGDSFRGFRIVGTEPAYLDLYGARLSQGRVFAAELEAVLGSEVARRTGVGVGVAIVGAHGLAASGGAAHEAAPLRVVGVLAPSGTVLDRLVVTPVASVWRLHESHAAGEAAHERDPDAQEVTAMLLRYRTPIAAATLPRRINATTTMQAASPAYENARLMNLVGVGVDAMRFFALVLMVTAAASVFVALSSALQERRHDLALLRMLGAPPRSLLLLVLAEGVTLVGAGAILGFALGHGVTEAVGRWIARTNAWSVTGLAWLPAEAWLAAAVVAGGAATALLPALQAYRRDPALLLKR